ncbi:MAG: hypothetical protein C6W57_00520 [Caldibacillus debilis]|nr:MAG: hypothetical protein BAA03_04135 [Caldibacillus debilis]REJ20050.1 MAG: hypothetical protein C6W57_00520 [Caldibacillus debilis]
MALFLFLFLHNYMDLTATGYQLFRILLQSRATEPRRTNPRHRTIIRKEIPFPKMKRPPILRENRFFA